MGLGKLPFWHSLRRFIIHNLLPAQPHAGVSIFDGNFRRHLLFRRSNWKFVVIAMSKPFPSIAFHFFFPWKCKSISGHLCTLDRTSLVNFIGSTSVPLPQLVPAHEGDKSGMRHLTWPCSGEEKMMMNACRDFIESSGSRSTTEARELVDLETGRRRKLEIKFLKTFSLLLSFFSSLFSSFSCSCFHP